MSRPLIEAWFAAEPETRQVSNPEAALAALLPLLTDEGQALDHERFACVALDRRNRVIDMAILTRGSDAFTIVDPKQVFRWALTRPGHRPVASIVIGHNHPSGDPTPSNADCDVTRRIASAGTLLGIKLVDHIIVGEHGRFDSFAQRGEL